MFVFFFFLFIAVLYYASQATQINPDSGNPKLPTVSQSRRVPLVFGKSKVEGPNVLDAMPFNVVANKKGSGGLFGGSQTVGYAYFQNIEMAIAYGPGILYDIYFKERTPFSAELDLDVDSEFEVWYGNLFGHRITGAGGIGGVVTFIQASTDGNVSTMWETRTGRPQPGYPNISRIIFNDISISNGLGFYWGNSENYPPVAFVYGYYPNPLNHATNHIIGNGANPAYCLYEIASNELYGAGIKNNIDTQSIIDLAQLCYDENLSFQRTYYDSSVGKIEEEILDFIEAVRVRELTTGRIKYIAIRDDYDLGTIQTLDDDSITELQIESPSLSNLATKIIVEYKDENKFFESVKVDVPNIANSIATGRENTVDKSFFGCANSDLAIRLGTREAKKSTRSRKQGKLHCNRVGWDVKSGDTIRINKPSYGINDLIVRVVEVTRGKVGKSTVEIKFIEEIFSFGQASYSIPTIETDVQRYDPAEITNFFIQELPMGTRPYSDEAGGRHMLFATRPSPQSTGYNEFHGASSFASAIQSPESVNYTGSRTCAGNLTIDDESSLVINGPPAESFVSDTKANVLANKLNLIIVDTFLFGNNRGQEIMSFDSYTYDSVNNQTTLIGLNRGLLDTPPEVIGINDNVWVFSEGQISSGVDGRYFLQDFTPYGEYPTPLMRVAPTGLPRENTLYPPANVRINGQLEIAEITGAFTLSWAIRDPETQASLGYRSYYDAVSDGATNPIVASFSVVSGGQSLFSESSGTGGVPLRVTGSYNPDVDEHSSRTITASVTLSTADGSHNSSITISKTFNWISASA